MPRTDGVHVVDIAVDVAIFTAQCLIVRYLFRDARPRLSKPLFRAILTVFAALCLVVGCGMYMNIVRQFPLWNPTLPSVLGAWVSAVEILWGFSSCIVVLVYSIAKFLLKNVSEKHSPARRRLIQAGAGVAMATPFAALAFGGLVERTQIEVKEVDLPIPGLHPDFEGFTVAQISDLHVSPYLSVRQAGRVVDMTNELKPRLTIVTGDLISDAGDPLDATIDELARLRADTGVLACMGNHETFARCEDHAEAQARLRGIEFLRLKARQIRWGNGAVNIAGVDYQPFHDKSNYLRGADKLILAGVPNILLSHNPDVFPVAARQGYAAVLSGHTHAGQVTVEILRRTLNVVRFFTPYVAGLYRDGTSSCYVNAGIGTIGMPVRLGAPPEITLFRLRRA